MLELSIATKAAFLVKEKKGKGTWLNKAGRLFTRKFRGNFWRKFRNIFLKASKIYLNMIE